MKPMRAVVACCALLMASGAGAQMGQPQSAEPAAGRTAMPHGEANESFAPGAGWSRKVDANGHMSEADYRAALAGELAKAEALVGKPLTDRDARKIRTALQGDLIAWRKQYDPPRASYRTIKDKYLVDEGSLSPADWAKQRVSWLRAQQEWLAASAPQKSSR
jgi:hypothetical protein